MSDERKKQIKRTTEVILPRKSTKVREGYQAKDNTLDKSNPPKGGSGVPPTESNVVKASEGNSAESTPTTKTSSTSETTTAKTSQDTSTKAATKDKNS